MITKKHSKQSGEKLFEEMREFIKPVPKIEERCVVLLYVDNHTFKKNIEGLGYKVIDVGYRVDSTIKIKEFITNNNYNRVLDENFSLINKDRGNMKIDYIITNPPYNGTLYLDILEYLIKNCSESEIVSINPNQHLTDILATEGYKKNSAFNKYKESVYKHIKEIKSFTIDKFNEMFNIDYVGNGAIYHIKPEETFDKYLSSFQDMYANGQIVYGVVSRILKKVEKEDNINNHYNFYESGNLVAVSPLVSGIWNSTGGVRLLSDVHKKPYRSVDEYLIAYRGKNKENRKKERRKFLNFRTLKEAQNFIDCFDGNFMRFYIKGIHVSMNTKLKHIPLLDMTQKWTNEKLCEYYNVSKEEFDACLEWYNEGKILRKVRKNLK